MCKCIQKIRLGLKRHPCTFIHDLLLLFPALLTISGFLEKSVSALGYETNSYAISLLVFITSLIISLINIYPKSSTKFDIKNKRTKIEFVFGDLFKMTGCKVIPVNDFFDSELGKKAVSEKSVHGQFIKTILGNRPGDFDQEIKNQFQQHGINPIETLLRIEGKKLRYPLGTSVTYDHNDTMYILFALSKSDKDCVHSLTPSLMLEALNELWNMVRKSSNGKDVNIPLIGHFSRVGLSSNQLIELILISIFKSVSEKDINSTIRIVLREENFKDVDLSLIKKNW